MKKKLFLFVVLFTLVFIPRLKACTVGYKVIYDANGGTGASDPMCVVDTLSEMRPKRSGYKFLGWAESPTATTALYQPAEYVEFDRDITLYAVWVKGYKINYDAQGGEVTSTTKTVYTGYVYGTLLEVLF